MSRDDTIENFLRICHRLIKVEFKSIQETTFKGGHKIDFTTRMQSKDLKSRAHVPFSLANQIEERDSTLPDVLSEKNSAYEISTALEREKELHNKSF